MLCPKDLRSGSADICWGRCFLHLAMHKAIAQPDLFPRDFTLLTKRYQLLSERVIMRSSFAQFANCRLIFRNLMQEIANAQFLVVSCANIVYESLCMVVKIVYCLPEEFTDGTQELLRDQLLVSGEDDFGAVVRDAFLSSFKPSIERNRHFSYLEDYVFLHALQYPVHYGSATAIAKSCREVSA